MTPSIYRARLESTIETRRARREAVEQAEQTTAACEHDWRTFRETIQADNPKFDGTAYFEVASCVKCHAKKRVRLVVL